MKGYLYIIILFTIFLASCSKELTEEDLIGGKWVANSGYSDGEATGEPRCSPFEEGIEFKDEDIVYVDSYEKNFEYQLQEKDSGSVINFYDTNTYLSFHITMIDDDEMDFIGEGDIQDGESCYFERE